MRMMSLHDKGASTHLLSVPRRDGTIFYILPVFLSLCAFAAFDLSNPNVYVFAFIGDAGLKALTPPTDVAEARHHLGPAVIR